MAKTKAPSQQLDTSKKPDPLDELFNTPESLELEKNLIFDQYKLYVDMADKVSTRRATTNSFFLTANSFLFVAMGALFNNSQLFIVIPIILMVGIFFCISWMLLILFYRGLNSCKYKIINEIETRMPIKGFVIEWKLLKAQEKPQKYRSLTKIEIWIPLSLIILYSVGMILLIIYIALNKELVLGTT